MTARPISRYPVPSLDELPEDIKARILEVQEKSGFVPNVFLALAHRPDEFRAFFAYHDALMLKSSGLTKGDREMIVVATSGANNCVYCVVAHGEGNKVLAKTLDTVLFQRGLTFIGDPNAKNYTVQADVMTDGNRRMMSNVGLINQRYVINLVGNWQTVNGWDEAANRFSMGFGIFGTINLSDRFSLQPELLFKDPRGASGLPPETFGNADLDPLLAYSTATVKLAYVSIPVILKYAVTPKLSLGFGPQVGVLSSAKKVYVAEVYDAEDLTFKEDIKSDINDLDLALAFNLEYRFLKKKGVHIGLRYYLGLTDIMLKNLLMKR